MNDRRKKLRKLLLGASGCIVLSAGIVMLVLPGPACVVIPLGLGILATEYEWARRIRDRGMLWMQRKRQRADDWGKAAISGRFLKGRRVVAKKGRQ